MKVLVVAMLVILSAAAPTSDGSVTSEDDELEVGSPPEKDNHQDSTTSDLSGFAAQDTEYCNESPEMEGEESGDGTAVVGVKRKHASVKIGSCKRTEKFTSTFITDGEGRSTPAVA